MALISHHDKQGIGKAEFLENLTVVAADFLSIQPVRSGFAMYLT
jgi:hypothetical protein